MSALEAVSTSATILGDAVSSASAMNCSTESWSRWWARPVCRSFMAQRDNSGRATCGMGRTARRCQAKAHSWWLRLRACCKAPICRIPSINWKCRLRISSPSGRRRHYSAISPAGQPSADPRGRFKFFNSEGPFTSALTFPMNFWEITTPMPRWDFAASSTVCRNSWEEKFTGADGMKRELLSVFSATIPARWWCAEPSTWGLSPTPLWAPLRSRAASAPRAKAESTSPSDDCFRAASRELRVVSHKPGPIRCSKLLAKSSTMVVGDEADRRSTLAVSSVYPTLIYFAVRSKKLSGGTGAPAPVGYSLLRAGDLRRRPTTTRACFQTGVQTAGSDDPSARRSSPADRDPHSSRPERAVADSVPPHTVRGSRQGARPDALHSQGTSAGWLHLRHSESARAIQIGRRLQSVVVGGPERSQGD